MKTSALYPTQLMRSDVRLGTVRASDWLCLAAAPTFAIMALVTGIHGGNMPAMLCPPPGNELPLSGMCLMYVLMSAFHMGPWLKLISRRRSAVGR